MFCRKTKQDHPGDGTLKKFLICSLLLCLGAFAQDSDKPSGETATFTRNNQPFQTPVRIETTQRGGGVAPTTWGFVSKYAGSLYGTGYYAFRVGSTYQGTNSIFGYDFFYPSAGFTNDIRAVYAFDVSSLGGVAGPIWSSFMFDVRETPNAGTVGATAFALVNLVSDGTTHTLQGLSLFQNNNAANLDIYDAEDFENADPFAHPEAGWSANNALLGTLPISTGTVLPLSMNVTSAVNFDINPASIPTLGEYGLAAFILLLVGAGVVMIRRNRA